jgi:hypothetical protein
MSKRTFGTNLVEIKNDETGESTNVVRSAFERVWSKRGWTLVEDEGSKEQQVEVAGELPESVSTPAEAPKPTEPVKLTALKTAQKKEQG